MRFEKDANINMTGFKGYVIAHYDELVGAFGKPDDGPDGDFDKVTCCWRLQFEDGTIASIYDWKEHSTPFYRYDWHIGGHDSNAIDRIHEVLDEYRMQCRTVRVLRNAFKKQDEQLGCKSTTPPELLALFNSKLEKLSNA